MGAVRASRRLAVRAACFVPHQQVFSPTADGWFKPSTHEHYLQRGPFQHVAPYDHVYTAGVKGRWVGRTLLDVFSQEFPYHSAEYYRQAILDRRLEAVLSGRKRARDLPPSAATTAKAQPIATITANNEESATRFAALPEATSALDLTLIQQHNIRHVVTRVEAPVLACGRIVITRFIHGSALGVERCAEMKPSLASAASTSAETSTTESPSSVFRHPHDGIVVFSKPPGLPVHPCGRYSRNTLLHMVSLGLITFAPGAFAGALGGDDANRMDGDEDAPFHGDAEAAAKDAHVLAKLGTTVAAFEAFLRSATLHTAHRLDKGTSGAILVGTSGDMSKAMHRWLADKSSRATAPTPKMSLMPVTPEAEGPQPQGKTYIARVFGDFRKTVAAITSSTHQNSDHATVSWTSGKALMPVSSTSESVAKAGLGSAADPARLCIRVDRGVFCKHKRDGIFAACTHSEELHRREAAATDDREEAAEIAARIATATENYRNDRGAVTPSPSACADEEASTAKQADDVQLSSTTVAKITEQVKDKRQKERQARRQQVAEEERAAFTQQREQLRVDSKPQGGAEVDGMRDLDGGGETYEQAKSAVSLFRFVSYDAATDESLVECHPLTGRTHQLRLHLGPVLGHPILFDTMYTADGGAAQTDLPEHWTAMTGSGTASVGGGADEPGQRSFMVRQKALQQDTVRCASLFGLPSSEIGATDHVPPTPGGGHRDGFEHGAGAAGFGEEGFVLCLHAAVYRLPLAAPGAVAVCDAVSPPWAA